MIIKCQKGFEKKSLSEFQHNNFEVLSEGILLGNDIDLPSNLYFPHYVINTNKIIDFESINKTTKKIISLFFDNSKTFKFEKSWPMVFEYNNEIPGLNKRLKNLKENVKSNLKKISNRIYKLADYDFNSIENKKELNGLFIYLHDFQTIYIGFSIYWNGQKRMSFDNKSPSRSFLKLEEAFYNFNRRPLYGENVIDLGAAPGGWSYSSAKEGAHVFAIDNGPLKNGALDNAYITHKKLDGFKVTPKDFNINQFDWLVCDMIENPFHVLDLLEEWIKKKWCKKYIVNLKFGYCDINKLITKSNNFMNNKLISNQYTLHLYHNRHEFTTFGIVK